MGGRRLADRFLSYYVMRKYASIWPSKWFWLWRVKWLLKILLTWLDLTQNLGQVRSSQVESKSKSKGQIDPTGSIKQWYIYRTIDAPIKRHHGRLAPLYALTPYNRLVPIPSTPSHSSGEGVMEPLPDLSPIERSVSYRNRRQSKKWPELPSMGPPKAIEVNNGSSPLLALLVSYLRTCPTYAARC